MGKKSPNKREGRMSESSKSEANLVLLGIQSRDKVMGNEEEEAKKARKD